MQFSPEGRVFTTVNLKLSVFRFYSLILKLHDHESYDRYPEAQWVSSLDEVFAVSRLWKNVPPNAGTRARMAIVKFRYPVGESEKIQTLYSGKSDIMVFRPLGDGWMGHTHPRLPFWRPTK